VGLLVGGQGLGGLWSELPVGGDVQELLQGADTGWTQPSRISQPR